MPSFFRQNFKQQLDKQHLIGHTTKSTLSGGCERLALLLIGDSSHYCIFIFCCCWLILILLEFNANSPSSSWDNLSIFSAWSVVPYCFPSTVVLVVPLCNVHFTGSMFVFYTCLCSLLRKIVVKYQSLPFSFLYRKCLTLIYFVQCLGSVGIHFLRIQAKTWVRIRIQDLDPWS